MGTFYVSASSFTLKTYTGVFCISTNNPKEDHVRVQATLSISDQFDVKSLNLLKNVKEYPKHVSNNKTLFVDNHAVRPESSPSKAREPASILSNHYGVRHIHVAHFFAQR